MSESTADTIRKEIDELLDKVEDKVAAIKNPIVRSAAEFAVGTLRKIFAIPDNDEPAETPAAPVE